MTRPIKCRRIHELPVIPVFKPRGVPMSELEETRLGLDEFEAVRLADYEGLYHEAAAEKMGISRQTFGNIIESARRKIADAIINSKALVIEGGPVDVVAREFVCRSCAHRWNVPFGIPGPESCPQCSTMDIHRIDENRGHGREHGRGGCRERGGRCGHRGE